MPSTDSLALTDHDLASALAAVDSLDALTLDADFAVWCDERRDAWVADLEASHADH